MAVKYIYIDDTKEKVEQGTINGIQDGGDIEVTFRFPKNWDEQIAELINLLPDHQGVILDLRLNDKADDKGYVAKYRGSSIAQELRTLAKENLSVKSDFPIVLISANEVMEQSLDKTSLDLFDECISKNDLGNELKGISYAHFKTILLCLAEGYDFLNRTEKKLGAILGIQEEVIPDFRFIEKFSELCDMGIVHVIARFVYKQVLDRPTFLINEKYLSARLGVDMQSEDWPELVKTHLSDAAYTGVFSNYRHRWWMPRIEAFWREKVGDEFNLRNTPAQKKVELLIEKTGLKRLSPLKIADKSRSDNFWVVCKATNVPLDTIDGFTISGREAIFPWQEPEYISISEALRPTVTPPYTVSAPEKDRLRSLKALFEKHEQRLRT